MSVATKRRLTWLRTATPGISRCGGGYEQAAGGPCRTVVVQLAWIKAVTVSAAAVVICQLEPHNLVHIADRFVQP